MKSQKKQRVDSNRLTEADHEVLRAQLTEIICHKALLNRLLKEGRRTAKS